MNLFMEILPGPEPYSLSLSLQGSCFKTDLTCKGPKETDFCDARGAIFFRIAVLLRHWTFVFAQGVGQISSDASRRVSLTLYNVRYNSHTTLCLR
jgi:hypothetical protein